MLTKFSFNNIVLHRRGLGSSHPFKPQCFLLTCLDELPLICSTPCSWICIPPSKHFTDPRTYHILRRTWNLPIARLMIKTFQLVCSIKTRLVQTRLLMTPTFCFLFFSLWSGPLHAGELQIPPPAGSPEDPVGNQRTEQPNPAEDSGCHVGSADAVHDPRHHHAACGQLLLWMKIVVNSFIVYCVKQPSKFAIFCVFIYFLKGKYAISSLLDFRKKYFSLCRTIASQWGVRHNK